MASFSSRTDWAFLALLALIVCAPFERAEPLFRLPGQVLTNVETVVVLALLAWLVNCLISRRWPLFQTSVTVPALLLIGLLLVSTVLVSQDRGASLRFTGRFALGFTIFLMTINVVKSRRQVMWGIRTMVLSGLIVAFWPFLNTSLFLQSQPGFAISVESRRG